MLSCNNNSAHLNADDGTYDCNICSLNGKKNSVRQYYVNLDTTVNMCSICQGAYLMEKEIVINEQVESAVSAKSLRKMTLLPLLSKDIDEKLSQEGVMKLLKNVYRNYKQTRIQQERKWNKFLSLVSHLLPDEVDRSEYAEIEDFGVDSQLEESAFNNEFYFDSCSTIKREEVTDADIEAAISNLTCDSTTSFNFDELADIDSLLKISSSEMDQSLPILSDETLFSPIVVNDLKVCDSTLKSFNENQSNGIKICIDFAALQKKNSPNQTQILSPASVPYKSSKCLTNVARRASSFLNRTRLLHEWDKKRSKVALCDQEQLNKNLRKLINGELQSTCSSAPASDDCSSNERLNDLYSMESSSFLNPYCSLQSTFNVYNSEVSVNNSSHQILSNDCVRSLSILSDQKIKNTSFTFDNEFSKISNLKMFEGFNFTNFKKSSSKNLSRKKKKKSKSVIHGKKIMEKVKEHNAKSFLARDYVEGQ